ncbi:winged helix-turn-helix transcriptional regulator [Tissierella praeacuta]|uniref:winged helix-turn-helix transcriptional regulator n=1 Tax=Tissierella praeacuta TaxID=43131 RepID=UPI0033427966
MHRIICNKINPVIFCTKLSVFFNILSKIIYKVLTQHLRIMEEYGLVHREVYPQVPPKVEYSLTELGQSLKSIHDAM